MGVRALVGCGMGLLALAAMAAATPGSRRSEGLARDDGHRLIARGGRSSCSICHQFEPLFSHPVGVVPSMSVPSDLPLSRGRMTCTTCHEEGDCRSPAGGATGRPGLRNALTATELCARCHDPSDTGRSHLHGAALDRAHLAWPENLSAHSGTRILADGAFDVQSAACLSCHDGFVASDVTHEIGALRGLRGLGNSHPIGVEYEPNGGNALRPAEQLDRRIQLFDNRVGCGSCHSPYSSEDALLVLSNQRSRLCLSCHDF